MIRYSEEIVLKKKIFSLLTVLVTTAVLIGCGQQDAELTEFHTNMDAFCTKVSEIDVSINSIDADAEDAVEQLLGKLDELEQLFQGFSTLDFPEEFDYLEPIAAESGEYMKTAVASYHDAYSNDSYNEYTAEYARENYYRAYKRVKIILSFLHGETPEGVNFEEQ